jgi:EAL domain-containing protein (putative c-di-GMP-specific phosphodiesterase class I)
VDSASVIKPDVLKIDQFFVRQISQDSNDSPIVTAIIDMGRNLKQRVIAEGVETQEQLAFLQEWHCAEGQGYLFSRPFGCRTIRRSASQ